MINLIADESNKNVYRISTINQNRKIIPLGIFVKGGDNTNNSILNLKSSSKFVISTGMFIDVTKAIRDKFGDIKISIMMSGFFTLREDERL